ncbi:unnamed protein product, partial [Vitis vinifera]
MAPPHFLLVSYPAQGHINPTLRLAKRLIQTGAQVTFVTTVYAQRHMVKPLSVCGLSFAPFSDGYDDGIDPSSSIELPGLEPLFTSRDLPSFLLSSNKLTFVLESFQNNFEALSQDENPKVLLNTFDALEPKALRALDKLKLIGIGPLIPSAFLDAKDPTDISFGGDRFQGSTDYIEWLNSKPKSSVIYISFGSLAILSKPQMEEIACGLLNSDRPFLWVIREPDKGESMVCGVPVVAFPQGTDQATTAKLITDMWKTGIRVWVNEEGMVERDEIKMCLEIVMGDGERAEGLRRNAEKWKELAREAMKNGGMSDNNLKAFVDEVGQKL